MTEIDKAEIQKYDYRFADNDGSTAAAIVSMVGKNKRVLEIGAGPGSISRVLKDRSGCNITAIEIDPGHVAELSAFCDAVFSLDLNDENWAAAFEGVEKFDTVVAAEILEHLVDPLATLKIAKSLLSQQGQIIVSLPHVGHAAVMACVFNSDFAYQQDGLLDRTHLRFFGIKNIQDLFEDAGLHIEEASFIVKSPGSTELMAQWQKLDSNVKEALLTSKFSEVYQVIVKASQNAKSSESIDITALIPSRPPRGLLQIVIPSVTVRLFIRNFLKSKIKPGTRQRIRRIARTLRMDM